MSSYCPECQSPLPPVRVARCPHCNAALQSAPAGAVPHAGTRMESVQAVREVVAQNKPAAPAVPGPSAPRAEANRSTVTKEAPSKESASKESDPAVPVRPTRRPPTGMLCIWDDDGEDGEHIRLRDVKYVLGRNQGQITFPHDSAISGSHVELSRVAVGNRYRWIVKDLNSTNGVYAAVAHAILNSGQEFIIGTGRFRFDMPPAAEAPAEQRQTTQAWTVVNPEQLAKSQPAVIRIVNGVDERRYPLCEVENWIGTEAGACAVAISDDPTVSRRHAKITCDAAGRWKIETGKCRNGLWVRIKEMPVDTVGEFLIGEQRFQLRVAK